MQIKKRFYIIQIDFVKEYSNCIVKILLILNMKNEIHILYFATMIGINFYGKVYRIFRSSWFR